MLQPFARFPALPTSIATCGDLVIEVVVVMNYLAQRAPIAFAELVVVYVVPLRETPYREMPASTALIKEHLLKVSLESRFVQVAGDLGGDPY